MARKDLSEGNITKQLIQLTWPMLFGILGIIIFNLVDTYFVGKLGVDQLAAMSFSFPVIMIFNSFAQGIGIGTSSLVSRNILGSKHHELKQMASRALVLGVIIVLFFVALGYGTLRPLFKALGAEGAVLEYVLEYMRIWIIGLPFVVIPMIGNNIIRATGDTLTPGINMLINGTVNAILDPMFIFGIWIFPELGMAGAALATVIGRATGLIIVMVILVRREKLITFSLGKINAILSTWKDILRIAVPTSLTMLIPPISMAFITRILSGFGDEVVAGFGVATRIEAFGLVVIMALGSVLIIFVGQNYSQGRYDRIREALRKSFIFSLAWGVLFYLVLLLGEKQIAGLFTSNLQVLEVAKGYFYIIGASYGFQGIIMLSSSSFNGLNKPFLSALLSVVRMFILYLPLAWLGAYFFDVTGVFWAGCLANVLCGLLAFFLIRKNTQQ